MARKSGNDCFEPRRLQDDQDWTAGRGLTRRDFALVSLVVGAGIGQRVFGQAASASAAKRAVGIPKFQVDATWPRMPNNWVFGAVTSVRVDERDHVWILQRPRSVPPDLQARAAPPVVEFDAEGRFVQAWGGPGDGYEWPDNEHGIYVDYKDRVWITGNNPFAQVKVTQRSDDMLLQFTPEGKFIQQFGHRDQSRGNSDTRNLKGPADVFVYRKTNEAFVADGYSNRRVIVLDADTGAFKRMWGAFGNAPIDVNPAPAPAAGGGGASAAPAPPPRVTDGPGPQQFGIVHGIKVSNDGLVYVGDRGNSRIQVFTLDGKYVTQGFVDRTAPRALTAAGLAFSPDAAQQFIYAADQGNGHVHILNRQTLEALGHFGDAGKGPGDFNGLHALAADSKGNIYTAEVISGSRAQRFVFKGIKPKSQ